MSDDFTPTTDDVRNYYAGWVDERSSDSVDEAYAEFDRWLAGERARVLREAAALAARLWTRTTNLPDPDDPEVAYSFDAWLGVLAARVEHGDE